MDKIRLTLVLALIILTALTVSTIAYYNNLKKQVSELQIEIQTLKSANLTAALGVIEEPPNPPTSQEDNQYCLLSHLWITGWVFNEGGSMAVYPALNILAFDENNSVLMNVTLPINSYNHFDTATDDNLIPKISRWNYVTSLSELRYGNILSQENATVRIGIFHEGSFPESTKYEIKPVWENIR